MATTKSILVFLTLLFALVAHVSSDDTKKQEILDPSRKSGSGKPEEVNVAGFGGGWGMGRGGPGGLGGIIGGGGNTGNGAGGGYGGGLGGGGGEGGGWGSVGPGGQGTSGGAWGGGGSPGWLGGVVSLAWVVVEWVVATRSEVCPDLVVAILGRSKKRV